MNILILILFTLMLLFTHLSVVNSKVYAQIKQNDYSIKSSLSDENKLKTFSLRVIALKNFFEKYHSPLVNQTEHFIRYADLYHVDWKLLPAIAGVESTFGKYYVHGSFNAYGWGGGYIYFKNWEDGIDKVTKSLKISYIDKGLDNVYTAGSRYAASKTWPTKINYFMEKINEEYKKLQ